MPWSGLAYKILILVVRYSCAIDLEEEVVITGSGWWSTFVSGQAFVYNVSGLVRELPKLTYGRWMHGCGHYFSSDNKLVRLI